MIVVTGAGGRLGSAVVEALLERTRADEVGVSTTRPEAMSALADRGVRVRRGDYDEPETLRDAFEGADRVLVISAPRLGDAAFEAHRLAIEAARDAGVSRVLYTSHVGADALSPFPPAVGHAATEVLLRDAGVPFTVLRNGFYADTPVRLIQQALPTGELRVPADAPVSWTTHDDLAPAIAALLLDPDLAEAAINLTAGEAVDMAALAETASSLVGRPIRYVEVDDDEYRNDLLAAGAPEVAVGMTLGIFRAARQRHLGIVDPALERLLGRPSQRLRDVLARALEA